MSNYVKATDFQAKDSLITGDPSKIIKGVEINVEFNAIQTAIATKADLASPAFTGNPTATTQATGNSSTRLATTAFVQTEINANEASVAITGGTIAGVAITGGTISGLATDLAVADGGTGASSITLNSVILGNNTGALNGNLVAPGASGNLLTSNGTTWISAAPSPSIGVGQTWQNVTGSRSAGVTYTNTTGKPIFVSITISAYNSDLPALALTVDGILVCGHDSGVGVGGINVQAIVPNNSTYSAGINVPVGTLTWAELR